MRGMHEPLDESGGRTAGLLLHVLDMLKQEKPVEVALYLTRTGLHNSG